VPRTHINQGLLLSMYIHFILYFLRTIKGGLHGTISEIKTQYITIPGTAVLSCQYENGPALRCASLNITLVSVVIELSCASHTYKPRSSTVVFNICNSYCLSSSLLVALNLSLPLDHIYAKPGNYVRVCAYLVH
jgi:hypothetical protein